MSEEILNQNFACKCLNVRFSSRKTEQKAPNLEYEKDFRPLFVGRDGITVVHNPLTLRIRSPPTKERINTGETRKVQHLSLLCLVCQTIVYRISTYIGPEGPFLEGPILLTGESAESVTLYDQTGWIEVHTGPSGCIVGQQILEIEASSSFSALYSVKLPEPPPNDQTVVASTSTDIPDTPLFPDRSYLDNLSPIFKPPPFTPSHVVFMHLAQSALSHSHTLRSTAEENISNYIQEQIKQVQIAESEVKRQTLFLWRTYQQSVENARQLKVDTFSDVYVKVTRSEHAPAASRSLSHPSVGSSRTNIRDFIPAYVSPPRSFSSSTVAGPSALSASLGSSSFYYPAAHQAQSSSSDNPTIVANGHSHAPLSGANISSSSKHVNLSSDSRQFEYGSVPSPQLGNGRASSSNGLNITGSLQRNLNGIQDVAATLRYYSHEADAKAAMEKANRGREENETTAANTSRVITEGHETNVNGHSKPRINRTEVVGSAVGSGSIKSTIQDDVEKKSSSKKKEKRKVTFDIEPAVVTITREINSEKPKYRGVEDINDTVFEFETDENGDGSTLKAVAPEALMSPSGDNKASVEHPQKERHSHRRYRDVSNAGLPASFSSLRPASLPGPSYIQRPNNRISASVTDFSDILTNRGNELDTKGKGKESDELPKFGSITSLRRPYDEEILKLVGADMPSHRNTWTPGSKSWKIFERRQKERHPSALSPSAIVEEVEDSDNDSNSASADAPELSELPAVNTNGRNADRNIVPLTQWTHFKPVGIPSSLPVSIGRLSRTVNEGVPIVQLKTSLTDREGVLVPPLPMPQQIYSLSSSVYTQLRPEREQSRSIDPGPFDFVARDDDDDDDSSLGSAANSVGMPESVSQRQALKIIQKRNQLPSDGMWRSLVD